MATLMKAKLIVAVGLVAIAAGAGFALLTRHSGAPDWAEFQSLVERALAEPA